ncbi:MAG: TolC family protein [Muribaculaceae bacterium]|nr:TolC family protein [Muribaculaceae bacterium]
MKLSHNITIGAIALVIAGTHAAAQTIPDSVYTLEQCKELALANNADIRTAENNLKAAIETRKEAFTKYFPEVSAGASAFKTHNDVVQYDVLDMFTLGIINKGKTAGIWALQPIFMGGQIVNGNKLAKVGEEAARIRKEQSADLVGLQTEALYWQLVTLKAQKKTVESALSMLKSLEAQVKAAVDAGIVTSNDLLKVNLKKNGFQSDLIDLDNGIELMKRLLAQQMGLGTEAKADINEIVPDSVPAYPSRLYMATSEALGQTADHKLLVKNVEAKALEKKMETGSYLPKVGVGAGWFYHDIFNQNHNFGGVMVTVSVPISGWWGGSHAIKRKSLELANARTELENLSQKLEIEMSDKWDNLTAAYRKMEIASEAIAQSKENLRITQAYYDAGMNTITDLLDAQTLYRQAQDDYIGAYGMFKISEAQYLNATGRFGEN